MRVQATLIGIGIFSVVVLLSILFDWVRESLNIPVSFSDVVTMGLQLLIWIIVYQWFAFEKNKKKDKHVKSRNRHEKLSGHEHSLMAAIGFLCLCVLLFLMGVGISVFSWQGGLLVFEDGPRHRSHGYTMFSMGLTIGLLSIYGVYHFLLIVVRKFTALK